MAGNAPAEQIASRFVQICHAGRLDVVRQYFIMHLPMWALRFGHIKFTLAGEAPNYCLHEYGTLCSIATSATEYASGQEFGY
jgi:hypothetical protein